MAAAALAAEGAHLVEWRRADCTRAKWSDSSSRRGGGGRLGSARLAASEAVAEAAAARAALALLCSCVAERRHRCRPDATGDRVIQ